MFSMTCRWPENSPCEKLSRAMFIPARIISPMLSGVCDAGPIVATILVLWARRFISSTPEWRFEAQKLSWRQLRMAALIEDVGLSGGGADIRGTVDLVQRTMPARSPNS